VPIALLDRSFCPSQTKPVQVSGESFSKLRATPIAIEILDAEEECSLSGLAAFLGTPKSKGMAGMKVTGWRRRKTSAIGLVMLNRVSHEFLKMGPSFSTSLIICAKNENGQ
jgi:hypothetical protein